MDQQILITGAGTGIGRDTAIELAHRGHHVIATTKTEEQAEELKKIAEEEKINFVAEKLNILDPKDRSKVKNWELSTLINNAAIGESGPLAEIPIKRVFANFKTNVFATLALTQLVISGMLKRKQGRVINISSLAGRISIPYIGAYSMTKFALEAMSEALRNELMPHNIKVCVIEPGPYSTGLNKHMISTKYSWFNKKSLFASDMNLIKKHEKRLLNGMYPTKSIVRTIVKAVESLHPKFRYSAPLKHKLLVEFVRFFGIPIL